MTTAHPSVHLFAGDDWEINATLIDENGEPFDLSGAPQVKWALVTNAGVVAIDDSEVNVTVTNAVAGQCAIVVPAAQTTGLVAGFYNDIIRLVMGGVTSTLAYGAVYITADPWAATTANVVRLRA
jgi:hypothetical protein